MSKDKAVPSIEEFVAGRDAAKYVENQRIMRTLATERSQHKQTKELLTDAQSDLRASEKALALFQAPIQHPKWLTPKRLDPRAGTLLAVLSDTHYGEVVRPEEMGGYNKFDLAIAEQRTERFFRRLIRVARDYFAGVKYDGVVLALGGDLVSGDIHEELVQTNQMSTYETVLWAVPRLAAGVELLAKEFGRMHVVSVPGNHGRDNKTPRYKGRSAHNADSLIANLVARQFLGSGDVTFDVPRSIDATFRIYDFTFALEHGEELQKKFAGNAEIGALGPLMRGTNRTKVQRAAEGTKVDYCIWAHFHQLLPLPRRGFIANGSLKGYDEYARGNKFTPEPPQQFLGVIDPVWGVTQQAPLILEDRATEKW